VTSIDLIVDEARWRFTPDAPAPRRAHRSQALLRAQLIDEVSNEPLAAPAVASTTVRGVVPRVARGGLAGLSGRPALLFHPAALAATELDLRVVAPGYLPLELRANLGAQPGYPDAFAPVDFGAVAMHRVAVGLTGRVASRSSGALVGAQVTVTGVWPVMTRPVPAAAAPSAMPCLAGLYADRGPGATVRRRNLMPAVEVKQLVRPAAAGDTELRLSDRVALAAGDVLAIEFGDEGRVEFISLAAVEATSTPDQAATATLDHPLRRPHPAGAPAARAVPGAGGAANALARPARAGDATVWTAGLAGIGAGTTAIEIAGGGAATEYQPSRIYTAATGPQGEYALPPIHRIASLELRVSHPSQPSPILRTVTLGWNTARQREDFLFP
jgi:hypothetical protein